MPSNLKNKERISSIFSPSSNFSDDVLNIINETNDQMLIDIIKKNKNIIETFHCVSKTEPIVCGNNIVTDYDGPVEITLYSWVKVDEKPFKDTYTMVKFNGLLPENDIQWDDTTILKLIPNKLYTLKLQNYRALNKIHLKTSFTEVLVVINKLSTTVWED